MKNNRTNRKKIELLFKRKIKETCSIEGYNYIIIQLQLHKKIARKVFVWRIKRYQDFSSENISKMSDIIKLTAMNQQLKVNAYGL